MPRPSEVARAIGDACRAHGFFYVVGHGIDPALGPRLEDLSHRFFALPEETKQRFAMPLGGRAWRGWFPLGGELTSGRPDWKEGLYLGTSSATTIRASGRACRCTAANLLPGDDVLPGFRQTIDAWMAAVTALGHRVMAAIARSLELPEDYFARRYTADPLILFRIFLYPSRPVPEGLDVRDGVGEHTDYGLLTLLRQDSVGGLQVRTAAGWIEAPPIEDSFVCNIGDMLDRMTGGLYRSTPHRVRLNTQRPRSPVVPAVLRPGHGGADRADPQRRDRRPRDPLGRRERPCLRGHVRRLPARQDRQGLPGPEARGAVAAGQGAAASMRIASIETRSCSFP